MQKLNAAGLIVAGHLNPRWKGGPMAKVCSQCGQNYMVKRAQAKSKFCSLKCVGASQRGTDHGPPRRQVILACKQCGKEFSVPRSVAKRTGCCSKECRAAFHGKRVAGDLNPNWAGGLSRLPYPWNFRTVTSKRIIERDGGVCQNPDCEGRDPRMTAHHINYNKQDCVGENLIALCSACNSKANFGREKWQAFYSAIMADRMCGVNRVSSKSKDSAEAA